MSRRKRPISSVAFPHWLLASYDVIVHVPPALATPLWHIRVSFHRLGELVIVTPVNWPLTQSLYGMLTLFNLWPEDLIVKSHCKKNHKNRPVWNSKIDLLITHKKIYHGALQIYHVFYCLMRHRLVSFSWTFLNPLETIYLKRKHFFKILVILKRSLQNY